LLACYRLLETILQQLVELQYKACKQCETENDKEKSQAMDSDWMDEMWDFGSDDNNADNREGGEEGKTG
jgi:hypothetical protein